MTGPEADDAMLEADDDIIKERLRQVEDEGYTAARDDLHVNGELATAAACYAAMAGFNDGNRDHYPPGSPMIQWPWDHDLWKPTDRRRDLVKAGALILAEIERLDRKG